MKYALDLLEIYGITYVPYIYIYIHIENPPANSLVWGSLTLAPVMVTLLEKLVETQLFTRLDRYPSMTNILK